MDYPGQKESVDLLAQMVPRVLLELPEVLEPLAKEVGLEIQVVREILVRLVAQASQDQRAQQEPAAPAATSEPKASAVIQGGPVCLEHLALMAILADRELSVLKALWANEALEEIAGQKVPKDLQDQLDQMVLVASQARLALQEHLGLPAGKV